MTQHRCPLCGFKLGYAPWKNGYGCLEICTCCGIQFGYTDYAGGDPVSRAQLYRDRRAAWIAAGMPWGGVRSPPPGWDPREQLAALLEDNDGTT